MLGFILEILIDVALFSAFESALLFTGDLLIYVLSRGKVKPKWSRAKERAAEEHYGRRLGAGIAVWLLLPLGLTLLLV